MTKFKSLLYYEFRVSRKNLISVGIVVFLQTLLCWAMLIVFSLDPESNYADKEILNTAISIQVLTMSFVCGFIATGVEEVFKNDISSGWLNYSYALPISAKMRAAVRMARTAISAAVCLVWGAVNIIVLCAVGGIDLAGGSIALMFFSFTFSLVNATLMDFFILSARTDEELKKMNTRYAYASTGLILAVIAVIYKKRGILGFDFLKNDLSASSLLWLMPLAIVIGAVRFYIIRTRLTHAWSAPFSESRKKTGAKSEKAEAISDTHCYPTGFLYKEIVQNKGIIIAAAVFPAVLMVGFILMALVSTLFAGEDTEPFSLKDNFNALRNVAMAAGAFIISSMLLMIFETDEKKLWAYFTVSTSPGIKTALYYKYVLLFALNGLYMVSWFFVDGAASTIYYAATGKEAASMGNLAIVFFFVLLLLSAVDIPMIIRFGQKKGSLIKVIAMCVIGIIVTIVLANLPERISDNIFEFFIKLKDGVLSGNMAVIVSLFPAAALALYLLSYKIACKVYIKGAEEYVR